MKINGKDGYLALLKGEKGQDGMGCYINGVATDVNFTSDPQKQLDELKENKANKDDIPNFNTLANKELSNVTYPTNVADGQVKTGAGDRVIETKIYSDGNTWYRKWASGWKECGGLSTSSLSTYLKTITLPLSFSNENYTIMITPEGRAGGEDNYCWWIYNSSPYLTTVNSFTVRARSNTPYIQYYCCGY